jgi:aminomethyltransferase
MTQFHIGRSPRVRPSPYFDATVKAGLSGVTVYNHMILPAEFSGMADEYDALVNAVTIWDVACERQVEIEGPDALALTQYLCTRDVSKVKVGQARYTFICNHDGGILNDPVLLRVDENRYWLSLADRDILLWAQAVAGERDWDVNVREPDVSPMQIQGPRSSELIADVFGAEIADTPYYRCVWTELDGVPLLVSRTGWSGEFGYEVFLTDASKGTWIWDLMFAAGEKYGAKPAAPNQIRRMEGGILSYGTDMDDSINPFQLGFDRMVNFDSPDDFIGRDALKKVATDGVAMLMTGARISGDPIYSNPEFYPVFSGDRPVGNLKSMSYSPRFGSNIGFVFVETAFATPGTELTIEIDGITHSAVTEPVPFVDSVTT